MTLQEALQQNNPGEKSESFEAENQSSEQPIAESVTIESNGDQEPASGFMSTLKRAGQNLKTTLTEVDSPRGKKVSKTTRDDFSVLVVSVVTLIVSVWKVDERLKPDESELNMLSHHLSGIMVRHLPINNKLSADALDVIGIIAVIATWQSRVTIYRLEIANNTTQEVPTIERAKSNGHEYQTPLSTIDPVTDSVMQQVKRQAAARGAG